MEEKKQNSNFNGLVITILIVAIAVAVVSVIDRLINCTNNNNVQETAQYEAVKENKNPYKITDKYDGLYKFELESDNGAGRTFKSKGIVLFDNGISKTEYLSDNGEDVRYEIRDEGLCGIDENDNFYFTFRGGRTVYKCTGIEKNISCKLQSEFDVSGNYNKELTLVKVDNSKNIDSEYEKMENAEKKKKEEEEKTKKELEKKQFKKSCKIYTFEQIARNPNKFKGTNVKLTGEVVQVIEDTLSISLRVNITKKGTYSTYYTDTIYVTYYPEEGEDKILEDDIITIYGTSQGDCTYTSTLGAQITLPYISAKYITLEK